MKNLKTLLGLIAVFLVSNWAYAQGGNINLALQVKNNQGRPMANKKITFTELRTAKVMSGTTDGSGRVKTLLEGGEVWQIGIDKIQNYWYWQIDARRVPVGRTGEMTKVVTYDYDRFVRETRPVPDRSKMTFRHVKQNFGAYERPDSKTIILMVNLTKADKRTPASRVPVSAICYDTQISYDVQTDGGGNAIFKLPVGCDYDIDVAGIQHFSYMDVGGKGNSIATKRLTYEPTNIQETMSGDTVFQKLPSKIHGTTTHEAISLTVHGGTDGIWKNQPIMLEVIKGKRKIYKAYTDQEGIVKYLLPKGSKYMIHGRFERDIDVIDLTRSRGIGYKDKDITYHPIAKYQYPERFIPKAEDLILMSFDQFFEKQLPRPKAGESLKTHASFGGQINANSEQAVLELAFASEAYDADNMGDAVNIAFVIDKSGSMAGYDRIESLREALIAFVEKLRPEDMVSLVIFDNVTTVVIPAHKIGTSKKELIHQISMIEAGGGTVIYSGMVAGYEEVTKNFKKNRTNRVVLLTDGYGTEPVEKVIEKSKEYNAKGIELSAVGIGEDYNVSLLKLLATHGGGLIELVKNATDLKDAFVKELSSILMPIGTNAKVEIEYNKNLLFAQLYGFPMQEKKAGKLVLKLKNIYAGLDQIGMVKFTLVNPTQAIENEPVIIRTKFYDLRKKQHVVKEEKVYLKWSPANGRLEYLQERDSKRAYSIAIMNQTLKVMAESFHVGDKQKAIKTLERTVSDVKKLFPQADDNDVNELMQKLVEYLDIVTRSTKG